MKKKFCYFLLIIYFCNFTQLKATTLNEAILTLYKNNNKLKAEKSKVKESRALFAGEVFNIMPDVRYSEDIEETQTLVTTSGAVITRLPAGKAKRFFVTGDLAMGNLIAGPGYAKKAVEMKNKEYRIEEQRILLEAISAYLGVIQAEEILKAAIENLDIANKSSIFVEKRFELGEVTKTDTEESLYRLSVARTTKVQAEGDAAISKAIYMKVFGIEANNLSFPKKLPELPKNFTEFRIIAEQTNLDLELMSLNRKAHKYAIANATNAILPSIHVTYRDIRNSEYQDVVNNIQTQRIYQATLNIPILPRGGAEYARIIRSKYAYNRATSEYMHATYELEERILTVWENLQVANANIESQIAAKNYAYLAMEAVRKELEYGSRTVLDLLINQTNYFNANVNLIKAQYNQVVAHFRVLVVMGKLDKTIFQNCKPIIIENCKKTK